LACRVEAPIQKDTKKYIPPVCKSKKGASSVMSRKSTMVEEEKKISPRQQCQKVKRIEIEDFMEGGNMTTDFSLRRSCFRGMTIFYKLTFFPMNKHWQKCKDKKKDCPGMEDLVM
jgi:hypothetical protein